MPTTSVPSSSWAIAASRKDIHISMLRKRTWRQCFSKPSEQTAPSPIPWQRQWKHTSTSKNNKPKQIKNMKRIAFESLRLLNFCGIRDKLIDFDGRSVIISARNGIGKSTVANAITYVLFGTDLRGCQFEIKTYDAEHKIIPEIEHSAELVMSVDGEPITLKRTLKDSWKGEQVKNTYTYFIDGEATSAGDFKKKVDEICPEITFRLASSPVYFLSKPWAEQRRFLEALVPARTPEDIAAGDTKFDPVLEAIKKESIDKLVSHLKYRKSEVQKLLEQIPTRVGELQKALPEKQDWESLKSDYKKLQEDHDTLQQNITKAMNGDADKLRRDGIQKRIDFAEKRKREMEKSARVQAGDAEAKHGSDLLNARLSTDKAKKVVEELQAKMDGYKDTELHINQQLEGIEKRAKDFNTKEQEICARKWEWNDKDNYCPHCGQAYPVADLTLMKQESEKRFKENQANDLKSLRTKFAEVQAEYTEANKLLEQLGEDRTVTTNQLVEAHKAAKEADKHLADLKKEEPKDEETLLAENPNYKQVVDELANLNVELEKPADDDEAQKKLIAEMSAKLSSVDTEINNLWQQIKPEDNYNVITKLIEEAQADKKKFQEQIDKLDEQLNIASEYYERSCSVLEEEVNKCFRFVKWSMFDTNLSGDKKPFCECYHDGVPYSSLNSSAKINAGIDIANTIANYYGVSVPIILDNCESNLHPLYSLGQQIRLLVTHDDELKVEQLIREEDKERVVNEVLNEQYPCK